MAIDGAAAELIRWQLEHARVVLVPEERISMMERRDVIVDLESGAQFVQRDSWQDFADRWVVVRLHMGREPSAQGLANAIFRAQAGRWSPTFCNAVAFKTLPAALRRQPQNADDAIHTESRQGCG